MSSNINNNFNRVSKTCSNTLSESSNFSYTTQAKNQKKKNLIKMKKINTSKKGKNIVPFIDKKGKNTLNQTVKSNDKNILNNNNNFEQASNISLKKRKDDGKINNTNEKKKNLSNTDNSHYLKKKSNKKEEIFNVPTIKNSDTIMIKNNNINNVNIKRYYQNPFNFNNINETPPPVKDRSECSENLKKINDLNIKLSVIKENNETEINEGNKTNVSNHKDTFNQLIKLNKNESEDFALEEKNPLINNNFSNNKLNDDNNSQNQNKISKNFEPEFIKQIKYRNFPIEQINNNNQKSTNVTILTKNKSFNEKVIKKNYNKINNRKIIKNIVKTDSQINIKSKSEMITISNNLTINHNNTNINPTSTMHNNLGINRFFFRSLSEYENNIILEEPKKNIKIINKNSNNEDKKHTNKMESNNINKKDSNKENSISTENNRDTIKNPKRSFHNANLSSNNIEYKNDSIQGPIEFDDNESSLLEQKDIINQDIEFCKIQNKQNEDDSVLFYDYLENKEDLDKNINKENKNTLYTNKKKEKDCLCDNTENLIENNKSLDTCCNYGNCFGKKNRVENQNVKNLENKNFKENELNIEQNDIIYPLSNDEIDNEENETIINKNNMLNFNDKSNKLKEQHDKNVLPSKYRNHKIMVLVSTIIKLQKKILRKFINKMRDKKSKITKFVTLLSNIFENEYKLKKIGISRIKNYIEKLNKRTLPFKDYSINNTNFMNNNTAININNINNKPNSSPKNDTITLNEDYYNCKISPPISPPKNKFYYIKKNGYTSFKNNGKRTTRRGLSWTNNKKENSHQRNFNCVSLLNEESNTDEYWQYNQNNNLMNNFRYTGRSINNMNDLSNNENINDFEIYGKKRNEGNVNFGNIKQKKFIFRKNIMNNSNESSNKNIANERESFV